MSSLGLSTRKASSGVWLLVAVHLLIALPLAYYLNIWSDEASSLYTTQNGITSAFQNAGSVERQAPLYFWILSAWRCVDGSVFFARLLSIFCSVAAIMLFFGLSRKFLTQPRALFATAFFALHPILFWASLEVRVYAMVILIAIGLIRLFLDGFFEDDPSGSAPSQRAARIGFVVLSVVALYMNYYLGFLLVGCFAALVVNRKWRPALHYLGLMAIVGVAFAPLVISFKSQFQVNSTGFVEERTLADGLRLLWGHVLTYILPTDIVSGPETTTVSVIRLWLVRAAILGAGILAVWRRDRLSSKTLAFGAMVATILGCLLTAYFMLGSWLIALRHASVLFVPLILVMASFINDLAQRKEGKATGVTRFAVPVFSVLILASFSYALVNRYPHMAKTGDWLRVGRYIEQNESPNQPIVIFHTYDALALPYQYHGMNRIVPDERFFEFDFGSPSPERTRVRTDFTISKIPADAHEIWLITSDECQTPGICEAFDGFIRANYDVVSEKEFYTQDIKLLRKKVTSPNSVN